MMAILNSIFLSNAWNVIWSLINIQLKILLVLALIVFSLLALKSVSLKKLKSEKIVEIVVKQLLMLSNLSNK
jgi:hypothetical protein